MALSRIHRLLLGRMGTWRVEMETSSNPPWNLRPEAWTANPAGTTHWSTITPIAYDQHPKAKEKVAYQEEAAALIGRTCIRIGLPEPREVIITSVSAHLGTPLSHAFPLLRRKDNSERRHSHAILIFKEPVCGPIILGAGRYHGYGLCRPLFELAVKRQEE
jgi:CRISPR-associated protein Csb2